jgi:hypothetical protein
MKRILIKAVALMALSSGAAQAALHDRGGGLVYDDVLNVTWLGDANYAKTSGYGADGRMSWTAAKTWADNLSFYDSVRNVTYTDWRLPTILDTGTAGCNRATSGTDCGYNVQTVAGATVYSELAHMYYNNLGFKGYFSSTGTYQPDFGIFGNGTYGGERDDLGPNGVIDNLQSSAYWSGEAYAPISAGQAWVVVTYDGGQGNGSQANVSYAWAVRSGDVAPVPEPETYAMLLAGLGLLGVAKRRRIY